MDFSYGLGLVFFTAVFGLQRGHHPLCSPQRQWGKRTGLAGGIKTGAGILGFVPPRMGNRAFLGVDDLCDRDSVAFASALEMDKSQFFTSKASDTTIRGLLLGVPI